MLTTAIKRAVDVTRERKAADFWEHGSAFMTRASAIAQPRVLIENLFPGDGLTLIHADPRSLKTWLSLAAALSLATGRRLGDYCRVPEAVPVGYITNEDGARRVADRLAMLVRGLGLSHVPDDLHLAVHRGVWLDDHEHEWHARVI